MTLLQIAIIIVAASIYIPLIIICCKINKVCSDIHAICTQLEIIIRQGALR